MPLARQRRRVHVRQCGLDGTAYAPQVQWKSPTLTAISRRDEFMARELGVMWQLTSLRHVADGIPSSARLATKHV